MSLPASPPIDRDRSRRRTFRMAIALIIGGILSVGMWLPAQEPSSSVIPPPAPAGAPLQPLIEPAPLPELAGMMAILQTLTHKLALSADAGNAPLAAFYIHESMEQLRTIQREAPEYENLPIAVLVERLGLPAYAELQKATALPAAGPPVASRQVLLAGLDRVVQSCNECHAATQHGFIQITRGTEVNPFNQSFAP